MKKIKKQIILILIFLVLIVPVLSFAGTSTPATSSLVPCTNNPVMNGNIVSTTTVNGSTVVQYGTSKCDFNALMLMVNKVISFILFGMVVPITAIMFAYAGFLMITAGGEAAHARTKAKEIFTNAVVGLIIAVACWLIVATIFHILGYDGSWIGLKITS